MNKDEIDAAITRYNNRLEEFGPTDIALGWGSKGRSNLRFQILLSRWPLSDASILDFGCGFGDLLGYIERNKIQIGSYMGVDINDRLLKIARSRYQNGHFSLDSLRDLQNNSKFDFVFSSGVFNHKLVDNSSFIRNSLDEIASVSTKGFAVNFLSDKVEYKLDHTFHANPGDMLELGYKYSNNVILRNDYMPFEFTLFVDLCEKIDPEYTVYQNFRDFV